MQLTNKNKKNLYNPASRYEPGNFCFKTPEQKDLPKFLMVCFLCTR